jgi:regulatory protein
MTETSPTREAALALLSRRPYGVEELAQKLIDKGHATQDAAQAAVWLVELGYLDDAAYAADTAKTLAAKGYGPYRIARELGRRLLDDEVIQAALAERPEDGETLDALIARLARGRDPADPAARRRLASALYRRGFSWDDINEGLARAGAEEETDWT